MKIPFDIKFRPQIESGEYKVVCGGGCYPVFILMWDFKDPKGYCILGYYEDKEGQHAVMYNNSGKLYHDKESLFDLFIVIPEPELSEFEKKLVKMLMEATGKPESSIKINTVKETAAELLELAKDEIYSHESLIEYAKKAKEEGNAEALKDLPRWKKAYDHYCFVGPAIMRDESGFYHASTTKPGCRYITYASLSALPGFKED